MVGQKRLGDGSAWRTDISELRVAACTGRAATIEHGHKRGGNHGERGEQREKIQRE